MNKYNLLIVLVVVFIASCQGEKNPKATKKDFQSSFSGEFIKRNSNLKSRLSDHFVLIDEESGTSKSYDLDFDLNTYENILINHLTGDTLDQFLTFKNKETYYLVRGDYPENYSIQAIRLERDKILGWDSEITQMKKIDELVQNKNIQLDSVGNQHNLLAEKSKLVQYFSEILSADLTNYSIDKIGKDYIRINQEENNKLQSSIENDPVIEELNLDIHDEKLNIQFKTNGTYQVEIIFNKGEIAFTEKIVSDQIQIDISEFESSKYLVLIKNSEGFVLTSQQVRIDL